MLIYLLIFITASSLFWLINLIFFHRKQQIKDRLINLDTGSGVSTTERESRMESLNNKLTAYIASSAYYEKQEQLLDRAYVAMEPDELIGLSAIIGVIFSLGGWIWQENVLVAGVFLLIGLLIPRTILTFIANRRSKQLNQQLPQALSLISNGLRAGFSFNQSLGIVNQEMEAPISEEFGRIMHENQLGKPLDVALTEFEERTDDEDISILVTTLLTQLQVGGDLAEILDVIGNTVRERAELRGQIRTMTAQSKMSALIIGFLPIGIGAVISMMNPEYIAVLFQDPLGLAMVTGAIVMLLIGIFALYKIVNIKV